MTALASPARRVTAAELTRARTRLLRAQIEAGTARSEALRAESAALRAEGEAARLERDAVALLMEVLRGPGNTMPAGSVDEMMAMMPAAEREAFGELYDEVHSLITGGSR